MPKERNTTTLRLHRKFNADKTMQKIVTDVTYIENKGKWYYLAYFLDLFNNIKPLKKLNKKPPVQFRLEQAA